MAMEREREGDHAPESMKGRERDRSKLSLCIVHHSTGTITKVECVDVVIGADCWCILWLQTSRIVSILITNCMC